jgi:hypothetical protein
MEAKWYVYELIDPRDDSVFYVGKGCGNRIDAHEQEARKGVCSYKCNKIRHLWSLSLQIKKQAVAYFWDESDAYEHEAERIASYAHTTNVIGGPCGKFVGPVYQEPEKPKEISLDAATEFLLVRPDILAHYLKATEGQKKKVKDVEITGFNHVWKKIFESWYKLTYTFMYPKCIDKVIDSPTDWKKVQNALLPYGVILENGSKNKNVTAYA